MQCCWIQDWGTYEESCGEGQQAQFQRKTIKSEGGIGGSSEVDRKVVSPF